MLFRSRAGELLTLASPTLVHEDRRNWCPQRFAGRASPYEVFTVTGKGGLKRQVAVSKILAIEVWKRQLPAPRVVEDREANVVKHFDLLGGQAFSQAFSAHSKNTLGFSNGAHSLRHTFAIRRMIKLQIDGMDWDEAIQVLANELGHFSKTNTLCYLR